MPTIDDISKLSGVSPATVSRVLRNASNVAPTTRELVLRTAKQLGRALPNELQGKRVLAIGATSAQAIFDALDSAAQRQNISLLWKIAKSDDYMADDLFSMEEYDGIILVDGAMHPNALKLLREKLPVVQCRTYSGLPSDVAVLVDDYQMGYDLAEHLLQQGCKRILYLKSRTYYSARPFVRDRLHGAMAAAAEAGLTLDRIVNMEMDDVWISQLMQATQEGVDGVILGMLPYHFAEAWQRLKDANIRIPGDLAIASYDDSEACQILGITAMQQPLEGIANMAMLLLRNMIEHRIAFSEPVYVRVKHSLRPRKSTLRK